MVRKRALALGLTSALAFGGCGSKEKLPDARKVNSLPLVVQIATYGYDPKEAGSKGSGELGTSERPLKVGERVVANCIKYRRDDKDGSADYVKLANTDLAGELVPIYTFGESNMPEAVFGMKSEELRDRLNPC